MSWKAFLIVMYDLFVIITIVNIIVTDITIGQAPMQHWLCCSL